jgi:DNA polymerase-3 subunit alpha
LAGIVDNLKVRQLKNGNILASAFIEDMYSSIGITIFSKAYEQFKELLQSGKPLIIKGKVSEREDREPEVILERAEEIPEREVAKPKPKAGLYIKIDSLNSGEFAKAKEILAKFKGDNPVIIVAVKENRRLAAPKELYVAESEELKFKLSTLLGEENVKFVK